MADQPKDHDGKQPAPNPAATQAQQAAQAQVKSLQGGFTKAQQQLDASSSKLAQNPANKGIQAQFEQNKKDMLGAKQDLQKAQAHVQSTTRPQNNGPKR
jgi:hypothetical protein